MKLPAKLETARLVIRPYTREDWDSFLEFMICKEVTDYLDFTEAQKTPTGAKELLTMTLNSYKTSEALFALVITFKNNNLFMGSCGFSPLDSNLSCECFYALFPQYWGQGFATEAMKSLFDYGFGQMNISQIMAHVNKDNYRSIKVAKKLGMKQQGVKEFRGIPEQGIVLAITQDEYIQ